MSIETLINVLTLLAVIIGSLYSLFKYIKTPRQEWLYLSAFFLSHLLSDYYWTTYTLVMGENPDVSAFMAYFGWNVGYAVLFLAVLKMRPESSLNYFNPMMLIPIPLGIWQFILYLPFGGILNNIWECVLSTAILCVCLQPLIFYVVNRKNGEPFPLFHLIVFLHSLSEFGYWTASCFDWPSPALDPYYYFSCFDILLLVLLGFSVSKDFRVRGLITDQRSAQETRFTILLQAMTAVIIFSGTIGGYIVGRRMKASMANGSGDTRSIAITLFVISIALIVFALMIIIMTAVRYNGMEGNAPTGTAKRRGRFNFVFTILITLSLMTASVLYTSRLFHKVSVAGTLEDGRARVKSTSAELENYLAVARSILWVTADTVEIMLNDNAPQDRIISYIYDQTENQSAQFDENFTGLYAYIRGEYMDGSGWVPPDDYVLESRDWYREAVDANGETVIVSPYVDADTGSVVITICKLLKDGKAAGDYRNRAVVALDMVVNHVQDVTSQVNIGGKGYAMVINKDGLIVSHRNKELNGQNIVDLYDFGLLGKITDPDNDVSSVTLDGEKTTLFVEPVLDQWYAVIAISDRQLLSETNTQLFVNIILSLIVFFLITFFYYLGYKNEQLSAAKMEDMRSAALKQEYEAQVLRQKEAAADEANKAKSNFLAQMSHEIRTPINAVLGMNEMILRKSEDNEILEYSENIQSAGRTLLALINSILDFSKIEDGKMDILPVNYETTGFIRDLVNSISQRAQAKGLALQLEIDESLPRILFGDDVRVTQICMNLLTNAVKYTEEGTITFTVRCAARNNGRIKIFVSVKDTGIGIKSDDIDKLTVSFERLEEKRNRNIEGTGLGMSIVSSLLEMMGSRICVESVYGEGSLFYFTLEQGIVDDTPIGAFEMASDAERSGKASNDLISAPSARILVVDDNDLNIKVATNLLRLCKIDPDAVSSGEEALDILSRNKYDIVLLDHMMPGMDGIETLHAIREKNLVPPETRMIVLTANAIAGAREEYLNEGFDDYLSKPVEIENLNAILKKHLPSSVFAAEDTGDEELEVLEFGPESDMPSSDGSYDLEALKAAGVDVDAGIRYCADDKGMYYEMLDFFISSHEEKKGNLNKAFDENDWPEYRILVHALKGNLRTLGMYDLSEKALALENASADTDEAFIKENHPELISEFDRMADKINKSR